MKGIHRLSMRLGFMRNSGWCPCGWKSGVLYDRTSVENDYEVHLSFMRISETTGDRVWCDKCQVWANRVGYCWKCGGDLPQ